MAIATHRSGWRYVWVWIALAALTTTTWAISRLHLQTGELFIALLLIPLMTWLVASWVAPDFYAHLDPGVVILVQVPFGAGLGLVVPLRRLLAALQRPLGALEG